MDFQIRPYQASDLEAIREIINDSILFTSNNYDYKTKTSEEVQLQMEQKLTDGLPILVGVSKGEACGFATYGKFRAKPGYNTTVEHSIYLNESAQGKGLGTAMMQDLIQIARNQGIHVMIAGMDSQNLGSYRFHERLGFKEVARIPEVATKFEKWLTLVLMQLTLD
jgi:phosphinothricin acetyltransferase